MEATETCYSEPLQAPIFSPCYVISALVRTLVLFTGRVVSSRGFVSRDAMNLTYDLRQSTFVRDDWLFFVGQVDFQIICTDGQIQNFGQYQYLFTIPSCFFIRTS